MAEMREAKAPEMQEHPSEIHHVEIVHHYHTGGRPRRETARFENGQHAEMAAHIAEHFPEVAQHLAAAMPHDEEEMASEPASEDVHA